MGGSFELKRVCPLMLHLIQSFSVVPRLSVTANPSGENLLEEGVPAYAKALDAWKEGMMVLDM